GLPAAGAPGARHDPFRTRVRTTFRTAGGRLPGHGARPECLLGRERRHRAAVFPARRRYVVDGFVMTARYRIQHTSRYEYDRSVSASFNEARLTPMQTPWQIRIESAIAIDPVSWSYRYTDYWGTDVR